MAVPAASAAPASPARDHGFHRLRVKRVIAETPDACSFVLDVPPELRGAFAYAAGQFCTFRATVGGRQHLRCYSMSSSPEVDDELQVTVKRVPGGVVSNWMIDALAEGDVVEATCPAGVFCLGDSGRELVAFAGGSGITPVFSLLKTALATTSRRVRLLYANRDAGSVIFAAALDRLAALHPGRLEVAHHFDAERGFVDGDEVRAFLAGTSSAAGAATSSAAGAGTSSAADADCYLCGPQPFMDVVEAALIDAGVGPERVHIERFTPPEPATGTAEEPVGREVAGAAITVTVELDGRTGVAAYRPGTTLLQTARQLGLSPPSSCEAGNCATCMARLVEGAAVMHANNALTEDEVADGWVLTCQAVPTTPSVRVVYGYEGA